MFSKSRTSFIFYMSERIFIADIMKMWNPNRYKSFLGCIYAAKVVRFKVFTAAVLKLLLQE
jgi:hypothetical protein